MLNLKSIVINLNSIRINLTRAKGIYLVEDKIKKKRVKERFKRKIFKRQQKDVSFYKERKDSNKIESILQNILSHYMLQLTIPPSKSSTQKEFNAENDEKRN